jgi:hypothetical protein
MASSSLMSVKILTLGLAVSRTTFDWRLDSLMSFHESYAQQSWSSEPPQKQGKRQSGKVQGKGQSYNCDNLSSIPASASRPRTNVE